MNKNNSHMKTLIKIFAGLAVLGAAASCQMYEIDTQMTPDKAAASIRMECSAVDTYNLPAQDPGKITFNVSSNTPWTITLSSGADWLTVSPASSASSALITDVVVTAQNNTATSDRSATLTLRGDNIANPKTITIKQARTGKLYVTPMASDYAAAGGPLSFKIQTNLPWEIHTNVGWLTFNRESGEPDPDGRSLTIIATAAPSNVLERTATVTVMAGDMEESFDVVQKADFSVTAVAGTFAAAGESKTFTIKSDLPWTVSADAAWLSFDVTEGAGGTSSQKITATAAANTSTQRTANVTVGVGGTEKVFGVIQEGFTFEIVAPESTELPRLGGEIVLNVNTPLDWEPATEVSGWSVEKINATSFKLNASFNDLFITKTGKVSISGTGGAKHEIEFTQDVNFTFKGHTEMLADGSVKVYEDEVSGVFTKDDFRYVIIDAEVEMHLGDKGSFTMCTEHYSDGYEYELQFNLNRSDAFRLRSNGGLVTTKGAKEFTFDKTKANAMTHGQIQFVPDPDDAASINQSFYWNGEKQDKVLISTSVFAANPTVAGNYFVGSIVAADDGSYFIIKSCSVTPVVE